MTPGALHSLLISMVPPTKAKTLSRLIRIVISSVSCSSEGQSPSLLFLLQAVFKTKQINQLQQTTVKKKKQKKKHLIFLCSACHSFILAWLAQQAQTCMNQLSSCKQHGISATISLLLSNILVVIMSHRRKGNAGTHKGERSRAMNEIQHAF